MTNYNCLVVDDEELARELLGNYIGRVPHLSLAGKCRDPFEALQALNAQPIDLLFLDIQMPGMTGLEFLRTLKHRPLVIFTTAYSEFALESYNLDATDYLLKPFSFERFVQAVNKATDLLNLRKAAANQAVAQQQTPTETPAAAKDFILVKSEHKVHRLRFEDIAYVEGMREYVAYHTPQGRILSLNSLKNLEEELPTDLFLRIHKSYIVAIQKVDALEGNQVVVGKLKLPIGASYRDVVLAKLLV
ncbi:MAG: response regulator transcription factor [Saprospiraceae bacterium]|nr:response regulator transcription factor [Saprospiraceae bacterium]